MYFNLNLLSDKVIDQINLIINEKNNLETKVAPEQSKITYETYNKNNLIENFIQEHKLTNQEKSLIKKFRHKD